MSGPLPDVRFLLVPTSTAMSGGPHPLFAHRRRNAPHRRRRAPARRNRTGRACLDPHKAHMGGSALRADPPSLRRPGGGPGALVRRTDGRDQILATWWKDNSTGVSRPKIDTRTFSFWVSALISLTVAGRVADGPSMTVTALPFSSDTT